MTDDLKGTDTPTKESEFLEEPTQPKKEDFKEPENYEFALSEYVKKLATYQARLSLVHAEKELTEAEQKSPFKSMLKKAYPTYECFIEEADDGTKLPFKPAKVAQWLSREEHFKTDLKTGMLYFYDGSSWIPNAEAYLEKILTVMLSDENKQSHFNNILHDLKGLTYGNVEFSSKLACPNGLLNVETLELTPNTADEMPLFSIPTEYIKDSPYPQWQEWLNQVMPNKEDQALLQEWSGYTLLTDYRFHKLLFNYGSGRNGKGTWERTLQAIIGESNVSAVPLEEFNGFHRFALFQLFGKLLNLCSEPTTRFTLQTSLLKKATGQDTISAERKGSDKRVDFTNAAKITVSANRFPRVEDTSVAFKERRLFLNWENEYLDSDGTQIQWIERNWIQGEHDERKGILCWMLEGLQRLLIQGHFTQGKTQQETEILFLRASNTIGAFKSEMLIFDKTLVTTRAQAFEAYKDYCDFYGLNAENEKKFTQALKETARVSITTTSKPSRLRAWKGFGLKILNEEPEQIEQKTLEESAGPPSDVSDVSDVSRVPYRTNSQKSNEKLDQYSRRDTSDTSDTQIQGQNLEKAESRNKKRLCSEECKNFRQSSCPTENYGYRKTDAEIPLKCPGYSYVVAGEDEQ
ncbi:MAG: phage/plasmid primase, P4 family [Candidatus Bathyarchaeia archaeon]|jgi:putative DNA primase/helicase